ncbi:MAG: M20/M25/M40 family metallo-hydrolase [Anaerolineales bacterium]|jgi:putative aminopeptidase FrvX
MTELTDLLTQLISASGLSGYEGPIREIIQQTWQPLTTELKVSRIGSLHGLKTGTGPEPRPSILLSAHMDAIGLMVSAVNAGFLHLVAIGGIDHRVLPGQLVTVHGRKDLPGVIVQPPARLLPEEANSGPVDLEYLLVDTGLSPREVERQVRPGDLVSFAQEPLELGEDVISGHSLDNRASVAAVTECLRLLQERNHSWDVWVVASVQEEETLGGALTSAFEIRPSLAVAIDVTFGKSPGANDYKTFPMGKGPTLGLGPNIHPRLHRQFKELADQLEIPYAVEVMPHHSGTDAYALQIAAEGIPTMVVSIPLRYMHTPVEMIMLKDIQRAGRLLAEFITHLTLETMASFTWDD